MAVFKCKMCGGQLEINEETSVCTCEYCGTEQTLPKVMDENLQGLFNRANTLRMKAEFDKAAEIYEKILHTNGTEAEAYWGLILCKYGIEYVEDPATYKRVPTCHRASYDAVISDDDYKMAIQYADMMQKSVYESEAKQIDDIQKGIIVLAQKEDPYDVFICYKETDENGKRTQDSVIANDIYYQLTQEGYKVFYAAITLEDKLGQEYEPYIFSALNSARVMLSIGTKPEYFNAVWVKNEWSRFLKIMKKDRARMLIPCYRDMDAYELPEEFAHLQAQDMSKIGFINDLVRGIKKVIVKEDKNSSVKETIVVQQATSVNANVQALLDRGNMALEDEEWDKADSFFEEVLNNNAKCAEAYIGKLLVKNKKSNINNLTQYYISKYKTAENEKLEACDEATSHINNMVSSYKVFEYLSDIDIKKQYVFDRSYTSELACRKNQKSQQLAEISNDKYLIRAQQYAEGETKILIDKMLEDITDILDRRITVAKQADNDSIASMKQSYEMHLDSADLKVKELYDKALERRENTYNSRVYQMNQAQTLLDYENVCGLLKNMNGYKDTEALADICQKEIDRIKRKENLELEIRMATRRKEADRQSKKKLIRLIIIAVAILVVLVVTKVVIPNNNYNKAVEYMNANDYIAAYELFDSLNGYKDSYELKNSIKNEYEFAKLAVANVGDTVLFGNYNGDTEWEVLDKKDGKILVISTYALEYQIYDENNDNIWESCSLREWLNGTYIDLAFNRDEQSLILSTYILNFDNENYGTDAGNNTTDKIFLLSIDEVNKYFTSDSDRIAYLSNLTVVDWWLRSPGYNYGCWVACVNKIGVVDDFGINAYCSKAVRPAMWIDISNL